MQHNRACDSVSTIQPGSHERECDKVDQLRPKKKFVRAGNIPCQKFYTTPLDHIDFIRALSIPSLKAEGFKLSWNFCNDQGTLDYVINSNMTKVATLAVPTHKTMSPLSINITPTINACERSAQKNTQT